MHYHGFTDRVIFYISNSYISLGYLVRQND